MTTSSPGFTRLAVDERRRRLLERGRALFTTHPYDELSMAAIARDAGISKALLYHYFPSKQAYFVATLQEAAQELATRVRPPEDDPPRRQLIFALDGWLDWVGANRDAYSRLMRSATSVPELRELVDNVRAATCRLISDRLLAGSAGSPEVRAAVNGWLWFMDGVCLDWVEHGDVDREHTHALLLGALPGILSASGLPELAARLL